MFKNFSTLDWVSLTGYLSGGSLGVAASAVAAVAPGVGVPLLAGASAVTFAAGVISHLFDHVQNKASASTNPSK